MTAHTVFTEGAPIMTTVRNGLLAGLGTLVWLGPITIDAQASQTSRIHDEAGDLSGDCFRHPRLCNQVPRVCNRHDLGDRLQRVCDRIRFRDEPHYIVANIAPNGGIRSYLVINTDTGQEVVTAYPFGIARATVTDHPRERQVRMKLGRLASFWRGRPVPEDRVKRPRRGRFLAKGPNAESPSAGFLPATGLALGWSPSIGPSTAECIDFTLGTPIGVAVKTAFSSQDQASSNAEQINVSATVKGSYAAFKASDTFSYSDKYQASANAGFQYWNLANIYTLNTAATGTFTEQGTAALNEGKFPITCGSDYATSIQGGFFATIAMSWSSSSSSTSTSISNTFDGNYELASLSTAATVATQSSAAESAFNVTLVSYGGGLAATAGGTAPSLLLTNAFVAGNADGKSYYALCAGTLVNPPTPDATACEQFSSAMAAGAASASNAFTDWVSSIESGSNVSAFALFPSGVAGVTNPGIETLPMPTQTITSDILEPYKVQLAQYTDILNQLATLQNRANHLNIAVKAGYDATTTQLQLSLSDVLNYLESEYKGARSTVIQNLSTCLGASSENVVDACQAVIDNSADGIETAYDWIAANEPQQLLLQNTIALQYSGTYTNSNKSQWPQDVVYYDPLPSWSSVNNFLLIGGQAGLIGFADAAYVNGSTTQQSASLAILPLEPTADLSEVTTKVYTVQDTSPPGLWFGWVNNQQAAATNDKTQPLAWLDGSTFCAPTFENPCAIGYGIDNSTDGAYPQSFRMEPITGLFPAPGDTSVP
jgi:hypothetical protein